MTQLNFAKQKVITKEMAVVAEKERLSPQYICSEIEKGRIVIPANLNHKGLSPIGIGRGLLTKINANIGTSSINSSPKEEIEKVIIFS